MPDQQYGSKIIKIYEGEKAGEAYFLSLSKIFNVPDQVEKLESLAAVESVVADAFSPIIERYDLIPANDATLAARAEQWIGERGFQCWEDLLHNMVTRYPGYIEKFKEIEMAGSPQDKSALAILVEHEIAMLAYAELETNNNENSLTPVQLFLEKYQ